nr:MULTISPECIES: GFA family protein [Pseudomonas]
MTVVLEPLDQLIGSSYAGVICTEATMTKPYRGSCLCSAVSFELVDPPQAVSHCHCSQCRKGHGAAFGSYGSIQRSKLRVLRGANYIKTYASSPTVAREFCMECGSTLFWSRSKGEYTDWISIALGTLDTPFLPKKHKHLHVDSAAPWYAPAGIQTQSD